MAVQPGVLDDGFDRSGSLLTIRCVAEQLCESKGIAHDKSTIFLAEVKKLKLRISVQFQPEA
jgi:hypothetical protein